MKSKVLVVVDVQRDFFDPSGSLYVGGSEVLPGKIAAIADSYDAVIFTLDWHPGNHCSFAANGGQWPCLIRRIALTEYPRGLLELIFPSLPPEAQ